MTDLTRAIGIATGPQHYTEATLMLTADAGLCPYGCPHPPCVHEVGGLLRALAHATLANAAATALARDRKLPPLDGEAWRAAAATQLPPGALTPERFEPDWCRDCGAEIEQQETGLWETGGDSADARRHCTESRDHRHHPMGEACGDPACLDPECRAADRAADPVPGSPDWQAGVPTSAEAAAGVNDDTVPLSSYMDKLGNADYARGYDQARRDVANNLLARIHDIGDGHGNWPETDATVGVLVSWFEDLGISTDLATVARIFLARRLSVYHQPPHRRLT